MPEMIMPVDSAIVGGQGASLTIGRPKTHHALSEKPMRNSARCLAVPSGFLVCALALLITPGWLHGQSAESSPNNESKTTAPLNWTAQKDHKDMMGQLGIVRLRPGPSGQPGATNSANYDSAKANPFPDLPEILTLKNGQKVTTAEMWRKQRRPEIVEDFEREVIGRVPKNVPKVAWNVVSNVTDGLVSAFPASGKRLVG